jgi:hypothetical protein
MIPSIRLILLVPSAKSSEIALGERAPVSMLTYFDWDSLKRTCLRCQSKLAKKSQRCTGLLCSRISLERMRHRQTRQNKGASQNRTKVRPQDRTNVRRASCLVRATNSNDNSRVVLLRTSVSELIKIYSLSANNTVVYTKNRLFVQPDTIGGNRDQAGASH